jgi:RES domain-containing protein
LLNALEAAPSGSLEVAAWRHAFGKHPPDQENTRGARWNPPGVAAIYLSLERDGAIAEGDHAVAIQPLRPRAPRFLYEISVTLGNVVDLGRPDVLANVGLSEADVADDDLTACQEVGGAAEWLGHDGVVVPSARSAAHNLVIFPSQRTAEANFDAQPGEQLT